MRNLPGGGGGGGGVVEGAQSRLAVVDGAGDGVSAQEQPTEIQRLYGDGGTRQRPDAGASHHPTTRGTRRDGSGHRPGARPCKRKDAGERACFLFVFFFFFFLKEERKGEKERAGEREP